MKRVFAILLTAIMVAMLVTPASAAGLQVKFNRRNISFDVAPRVENGRTLVPFRAIFEKMGATVGFDAATNSITATRGSTTINLTIGSTTAMVNGKSVALDVAPKIIDDRTVVPLRFVGEALGGRVNYDGARGLIDIVDTTYPKRGGTVTMSIFSAWAPSFSPFNIANDVYTGYVSGGLYTGYWNYNDKVNPTPDGATHWEISDDNKTITYYLRNDMKFHDGTPVTAKDFALYYYVTRHPDYKGPVGGGTANLQGFAKYQETKNPADLTGVKIIDDYTIAVTAEKVEATFFLDASAAAVPHHLYANVPVADIGTSKDPNNANPIGSGPWIWDEYREGQYIIHKANRNWHGGEIYLDKVIWKVQPAATAVAAMETGAIDWMEQVATNDIDALSQMSHVKVVEYAGGSYQVMNFNTRVAPLNDARMRQAIAYAVDRGSIIQNILKGHGSPMHTPIHPLNWAYNDNVENYAFNTAKAKQLIESMGYTMGGDGYYQMNGQRLKLKLNYPTGNPNRVAAAPVVQQMLKDVGIEVELEVTDFSTMFKILLQDPMDDWQMSFSGWSLGSPDPDPRGLYGKEYIGPGNYNLSGWWTAESDLLLDKAAAVLDIEERMEYYFEWQEMFAADIPVLVLYNQNKIDAINTRIVGYNPHPYSYGGIWNLDEWWVTDGR